MVVVAGRVLATGMKLVVALGLGLGLAVLVLLTTAAPMKEVAVKAKGSCPKPASLGARMDRKLRVVIVLMDAVTSSGVAPMGHGKVKVQSMSKVAGVALLTSVGEGSRSRGGSSTRRSLRYYHIP